jgi:YesN/AraC family two-component response regulator
VPVLFCALLEEEHSGSVLETEFLTKPAGPNELKTILARYGIDANGAGHGHSVLIVDDEPGLLRIQSRIVRAQLPGCRILTALNGRLALDIIRQELPDVVLLDLMMPELDGFAVLENMRAGVTTRDIPVVVLTGHDLTEQDMERLNHGVVAVMRKGLFSWEETMAQVEAALARHKRLGGEAQRLVRRAMAYLEAHSDEEISRTQVADHLAISDRHLTRCFRQELGITPTVYLNRYRVDRAKRTLEAGQHTVTETAMKVGFSSQSYFSRVFKSIAGVTPSEYQRGVRSSVDGR